MSDRLKNLKKISKVNEFYFESFNFLIFFFQVKTSEEKAAGDLSQYELLKKDVEGSCIRRNGAFFLKPFDKNLPRAFPRKFVKNEVENKFLFDIYQKLDRSKIIAKNIRPAKKD